MATTLESVYKLKCSCNQYPWGKQGQESIAARLCEKQQGWDGKGPETPFKINNDNSYAEMWMGTYPDLPSYVEETGEDLQAVLDRHPKELVGQETLDKFGHSKLPYLPKVLSIAKALPLQLHPNKEVAAKLHKEKPDDFTDPNHKPEIALALGKFEAFCGFKPLEDIATLLKLEPLQQFLPKDTKSFDNQTLKSVVGAILKASDSTIKSVYNSLTSTDPSAFGKYSYIPTLAPRLAEQYSSSDPGTLVALITMNYLVLSAGESIYIPADGIHAYLSGDIIECMARSNNVLNTGFCPRAERSNIDLFLDCLTFTPHSAEEAILKPKPYGKSRNGKSKVFAPPLSEFDMLQTELGKGEQEVLEKIGGPSILLATKGSATMKVNGKGYHVNEGAVFFVGHGVEVTLDAGDEGLLLHTALVEGSTS
ncbi:Putative mannose-6-phosphate isomerase, type I, rmlC-like cupin domain superfamily [Septoria linicola]|uniref:Mannose-6-phosphate isomerase n=1 Tax=Septoria linicola TaxID=215465 RepID=A0A9Q9EF86_9PEZI|nr:Putative mannose-6-phosphate isomerase, type I, rmlC-like cupin domain superfamily [Septoria linicola]